jgi:thiazole/oxazole-forming peptide maturase SagD family component
VRLVAGEEFRYTLHSPALDRWLPRWLGSFENAAEWAPLLKQLPGEHQKQALEIITRLYGERVLLEGNGEHLHLPPRVAARPHDPQVSVCAGIVPHVHPDQTVPLDVGGCGWSDEEASAACVGEGIERLFAYPTDQDTAIESSYDDCPLDEPAVPPDHWVLFHPQQYGLDGFPFEPLTHSTRCRWVCFREVLSGEPRWVPEEFAYLYPRAGCGHRFCPTTSTGLAAGSADQPVVLRAMQEVIERDALLGAWWAYPVEEFSQDAAWGAEELHRLQRPNLRWRFFRVLSPFSHHVTMVTVEGEDREGFCHSIGSACRESHRASWIKATLEAVQGRHYVRHLRQQRGAEILRRPLETFADHAVYYSLHRDELNRTILNRARPASRDTASPDESLPVLCERLKEHSVLVRNLTPPMLAANGLDWRVVKVIVPGLQPLHGADRFAHLGGRLWMPRDLKEWGKILPHPFP